MRPSLLPQPRAGIALGEHLVLGHRALARHQALGHGPAMEQDHLIFILAVVVVPIQHRRWALRWPGPWPAWYMAEHRSISQEAANAAVVQLGQQHAGADAQNGFHLVPAAQRQRVQMVLLDIIVDHHGNFCQRALVFLGHAGEIAVAFQPRRSSPPLAASVIRQLALP